MGIIYKVFNKVSKKLYIGQTIHTLEYRKEAHFSAAKSSKQDYHMLRALRFYEKDDWEWSIIEENIPQELLNEKEIFYIKQFDTFENGYNSNHGGNFRKLGRVYELWHPNFGELIGCPKDILNITKLDAKLLSSLYSGTSFTCKGWRLLENKDLEPPVKKKREKPLNTLSIKSIIYN